MTEKEIPIKEMCERYRKLIVPLVSDSLDEKTGWKRYALAHDIKPLTHDMKVAGPAFTIRGEVNFSRIREEDYLGLRVLDLLTTHCVLVIDTGHDDSCAHWGELSSVAARAKGCQGVVVDGGTRDTPDIINMKFPVFTRFTSPLDALGRWKMVEYQIPVEISGSQISPGDFIVGDNDGVVVVPKALTIDILLYAENYLGKEKGVRGDLAKGAPAIETYKKHGKF